MCLLLKLAPLAAVTNLVLPDPTSTALTIKSMRRLRVGVAPDQDRQRDPIPPHGMPSVCSRFRHRQRRPVIADGLRRHAGDAGNQHAPEGTSCVSPRSHPMSRRQPPGAGSRRGAAPRSPARRAPRPGTRGGRFPCQPRMDPRSAALRDDKRGSRQTRTPENATCKGRRRAALARRRRSGALTDPPATVSTAVSRGSS